MKDYSNFLTRRLLLGGAAACATTSFLPGAFLHAATLTSDSNPQPIPSGTIIDATLTVTSPTAPGAIGERFAGLSYEKSTLYTPLFSASNTDLIALFKLLGSSVVRIGGNSVDQNVWTPNGLGQTAGQIAPSDVDSLAAFVKAAGWRCLYGINLGGSATGATNTTLAAEEAAYVYSAFGNYLLGIEIGNEPDLYGQPGHYYAGNWSLSDFEALWGEYRAAILARTPSASIMGPSMAMFKQLDNWTIPFAHHVGKKGINALSQHFYRGDATEASVGGMIKPDPQLISGLAKLKKCAQEIGVPFRLTECNCYFGYHLNGIIDTYATSLWVIDFLFQTAIGGALSVNMHSTPGGNGYAPIAFSRNGQILAAHPEYYGMLFFNLAGQGTIYKTEIMGGSADTTAYAVKTDSGGLNVVVNNKDTKPLHLSIQLPQAARSATLMEMTQRSAGAVAPNIKSTSGVIIQGATVNPDASFSPVPAYTLASSRQQVICYVSALSAALIQTA